MGHHMFRGRNKYMFAVLLVVGTGCMMIMLWKQNDLWKQVSENSMNHIVEWGFEGSGTVEYLQEQQSITKKYAWMAESVPVLSYLAQNQGELEVLSNGNVEGMALIYPGKNSSNVFWSGASSEKIRTRQLFEGQLAEEEGETAEEEGEAVAQEADSIEASVIAENEQVRAEENDEENEDGEGENTDQGDRHQDENYVDTKERILSNQKKISQLKSTLSLSYLLKNFYIVDSSTSIDKSVFDVETLLNTNLTLKKRNEPQILIYHTHGGSERFIDSTPGNKDESIVGMGEILKEILEEKYGYQVIHDTNEYDRINGRIDRSKAYNKAYTGVKSYLKRYPSIQVVIDLHRDGVGNKVHRLTTINGKKTAQVMFFNGLSRNRKGDIKCLKNENLQDNLAFSLQMKMKSMELYSDFAKPVYLKGYRYNLHLRKRSLLIELGNENNTVQEAENAMEPLANVLNQVLSGK